MSIHFPHLHHRVRSGEFWTPQHEAWLEETLDEAYVTLFLQILGHLLTSHYTTQHGRDFLQDSGRADVKYKYGEQDGIMHLHIIEVVVSD